MAHLITCNNGYCFFSHEFSDLLVGQMKATLEGKDFNVCIRTSEVPSGALHCWPNSLADDFIHRPIQTELEYFCIYDMTSQYKKVYKSYKEKSIDTYEFSKSHPGYKFSHSYKLKHSTIPRISLPHHKFDDPTSIHTLRKYVGQAEEKTSIEGESQAIVVVIKISLTS